MMPSFSQVLDHQLIFHIIYGLTISSSAKQKREEEREDLAKKKQQLLSKHRAATDGKNSQKTDCCHMVGRPLQIHQAIAA